MRVARGYQLVDCVPVGGYARVIDINHPIVIRLVELGYKPSVHAYLRNGRVKASAKAHHADTGVVLHGWSKDDNVDGAWNDLAKRGGLDVG